MAHGVLAINAGSSSVRFGLFDADQSLERVLSGIVDRVGVRGAHLTCSDADGNLHESCAIDSTDPHSAVASLLDWLEAQPFFASVAAVGHRVVHGMTHGEPERVTPELLAELRCIEPSDPKHLPLEIELMEAFRGRHPAMPQVACFDTAFHGTLPRVARLLPVPRRYEAQGVRRYGFHGVSYAYLMEELTRLGDPAAGTGRVVLAHLGNGSRRLPPSRSCVRIYPSSRSGW